MTREIEDEELKDIVMNAALDAVRLYDKEQKKQEHKRIIRNTFTLMENYRSLKGYPDAAISESDQIGSNEKQYLESIRGSRIRTALMIQHIDHSIKELEKEAKRNGDLYKMKAFKAHYIQGKTYEDIQEEMECGKNSPARWCKDMVIKLSVKLFGIDGIKKW